MGDWDDRLFVVGGALLLTLVLLGKAPFRESEAERAGVPPWRTKQTWPLPLGIMWLSDAASQSRTGAERWARGLFGGAYLLGFVVDSARWWLGRHTGHRGAGTGPGAGSDVRVEPEPAPRAVPAAALRAARERLTVDGWVRLPALGEGVAEGTVTRWLKRVGEPVRIGEPLFEVSTGKVDTEIPSPAGGVLVRILVPAGRAVAVGSEVARISPGDRAP